MIFSAAIKAKSAYVRPAFSSMIEMGVKKGWRVKKGRVVERKRKDYGKR